jgi:hypothetical protein
MRTTWEGTLVQIGGRLNYRSATENMFEEVIKWDLACLLGNISLFSKFDYNKIVFWDVTLCGCCKNHTA